VDNSRPVFAKAKTGRDFVGVIFAMFFTAIKTIEMVDKQKYEKYFLLS
jgi:hypothetical protein